jgi:ubiquinone/menaquinone biosynthesis C-methylase UbiE
MSHDNWKKIWEKRSTTTRLLWELQDLIRLDGFDVGAGFIDIADWRSNARAISETLGICDNQSVYEVGCGSGAFLCALMELHAISVGGLDYSHSLIDVARRVIQGADFSAIEAVDILSDLKFDYVISHGVFHYFDLDYAERVLEKMIKKSNVAVGVFEIPNLEKKVRSEEMRRGLLGNEEYDQKYTGLEHTYYSRKWFKEIGIANGLSVEFFESCVPNSEQSSFRFNCVLRK